MSNSLGEAVLDILADTSKLEDGINGAQGKTLSLLNGLSKAGGAIFAAGLAVATTGVIFLGKALYDSVQEASEAQQVQAQLNAVLESTGGIAGVTADKVNELADALSKQTMFDDEAIVSAESLLLTFTNISQDIFPQATEVVLDMSQALGQDLSSSAIQLGKALQDPILGVSALRRVGVNFSEDQQKVIEALVESGKLEEAQAMILKELQTEFGGSAKAAGQTFAGQLKILQTQLGNTKEMIGAALLPTLTDLATMFNEYLSRPETQEFIRDLAAGIADFAKTAVAKLPAAIQVIKDGFGWLAENQGVIVGALAAIGVALAAFLYTTLAPLLPIIAIMAAIAAIAYLVYQAWTNNWGGIQEKVAAVWAVLQPIFAAIVSWLQTNIPIAIGVVSAFWTNTLLPAIQAVWGWLSGTLFPFLQSIAHFLGEVFGFEVAYLAAVWETVLWPALKKVIDWMEAKLMPVVQEVARFFKGKFADAFDTIKTIIDGVTQAIQLLTEALNGVELPDDLTPGSPTPFETGLRGIHSALMDINRLSLPMLTTQLQAVPVGAMSAAGSGFGGAAGAGGSTTNVYVYGVQIGQAGRDTKISDILESLSVTS